MNITRDTILQALQELRDPLNGTSYSAANAFRNITVSASGDVSLELELGYAARSLTESLRQMVIDALRTVPGIGNISVSITTSIITHAVQRGIATLPQIKNIIAVASGKGGVGKSTTSVNLALALAAEGARVGMLDADIYGPSLPMMLGLQGPPQSSDGQTMDPVISHGLQAMSIGLMVAPGNAMVWRGPMAVQALEQMLRQTNWNALDYLVVDLPPGTGDIQLSLAQKVPVTGVVIVTTPQDIALIDARKAVDMFGKVSVPILGLVENMAVHICKNCGHAEHIFGADGGRRMAQEYDIHYLGALPLDIRIREQADGGKPTVVAEPESENAAAYRSVALNVAAQIALMRKDYSGKIPPVSVG